jgi:hypothetical protein
MPVTQANPALRAVALLLGIVLSGTAFAAVPTVTAMSPNSGTIAGGQVIVITGTNLNTPAVTSVTFGGTAGTNIVVISNTQLQVTTPAKAAGVVTVIVNNGSPSVANPPATNYTFTNANTTLQVTVRITIPKRADLEWGATTSADDLGTAHANTISAFVWIVNDAALGAFADVASTYTTTVAPNVKTLSVSNVSKTNAVLSISAMATDTLNWTNNGAGGPGVDQFRVRTSLGATPLTITPTTAVALVNNLTVGAPQAFAIEIQTPTSIAAASAAVTQTTTVTLTATAN